MPNILKSKKKESQFNQIKYTFVFSDRDSTEKLSNIP